MSTEPALTAAGLNRLMTWLSPAYPVGGFSYSHGLEYAVEAGEVTDKEGFAAWAAAILRFGAGHADAVFFCHAWRAVTAGDPAAFAEVAERAAAMRGTAELALEASAPGAAFIATLRRAGPPAGLEDWLAGQDDELPLTYPVAVAVAAALAGLPLGPSLTAYLHAFAANLVSAAVRLIPLGQTEGQAALAELEPVLLETAQTAPGIALADLGTAALTVDWASMRHETQYTRLFRS